MRIALAQLNPVVGDVAGNLQKLELTLEHLAPDAPDLVVFPELFLTGYPPRDLLARAWFADLAEKAVRSVTRVSDRYPGLGILFGAPVRTGRTTGKGLHNAAIFVAEGRELLRQAKSLLPTYDVFDETRYFDPGTEVRVVKYRGQTLGVSVCEDAWGGDRQGRYEQDPIAELCGQGATLLLNISASPFSVGKPARRRELLEAHCLRHGRPLVFVNQVGANDELVFDGLSLALDCSGRPQLALPGFEEAVSIVDTNLEGSPANCAEPGRIESVYEALVLGIRDYVRKCGFRKAVLGLSGGVDSAVTCCLAVAALGKDNVLGVTMPSEFSSSGSVTDSERLAANLGIELWQIPISDVYHSYVALLKTRLPAQGTDVTRENIQARVRGNILMAVSNQRGHLLLSTGNKSELAVGYCTLYGDMSGGLCVLSDVPKTMVYELARHVNEKRPLIPAETIAKPPSAELRPNQTDQDTLPPYDVLDAIIARYVDAGESPQAIEEAGFERRIVDWVVRAVNRNEYKRRQAAPGIKVTSTAFGVGWRMPIAARY
jgi:NAD+ synthase (glutamine-hydrolysing)